MKARYASEVYTHSFGVFQRHTDEKQVLYDLLQERLAGLHATSLLDIGAGSGDLALPLSKLVELYVAIEQRPAYVSALRQAGIPVIEAVFPTAVLSLPKLFDVVLSSHSLPWKPEEYQPFIERMLKLTRPGGKVLLITYDGASGPWHTLLTACGLSTLGSDAKGRFPALFEWLGDKVPLTTTAFETRVVAASEKDMLEALAFVYSDGDASRIEEFVTDDSVVQYLRDHHKKDETFTFPFNHAFIELSC